MAKKLCSIDNKPVGLFDHINLKDGIICFDCVKRLGIDKPMKNKKLLNGMTIDLVNAVLDGDLLLSDYIAEHNRQLTQATVQKLKDESAEKHRKENANAPRCPKCGSTSIQIIGNEHKAFSVGKAAAGAVLAGGVGTLAGFAGKKGKKVDMICMNCGKKFKY